MATLRGGIIAVGGAMALMAGQKVASVNAEFQDLQLTLETVFGGMEEGEAAMDFITEFAQRTPFDIQTLSRAFIQLGGAGIKPTEELLTTFGDAAAATTNKVASFEAMVRIATRAVGGGLGLEELEQLVNQGIPVYQILQDEIGVTRQEISDMGQSAEGAQKIMAALQTGLNKRFGGGMERASQNLSVAMSNLGIAGTELIRALGDGVGGFGLTGAFTFLSDTLTQVAVILKPVVNLLGAALAGALYAVMLPIRAVTESLLFLGRTIASFLSWLGDKMPEGWETAREGLKAFETSLTELEATMNRNIQTSETVTEAQEKFAAAEADLADQIKEAKAILAGYSAEQIAAFKAAELWSRLDFNSELGTGLYDAGDGASDLADKLTDLISQLEGYQAQIDRAAESDEFEDTINAQAEAVHRLSDELDGLSIAEMRIAAIRRTAGNGVTEEQLSEMATLINLEERLKTALEERKDREDRLAAAADEEAERQTSIADRLRDLTHENDMLRMAVEGRTESEIALARIEYELGHLTDGQREKLAQLREEYDKLQATYEMQEHLNNFMKQSMESVGRSISDNLADAVMSGKFSLDSLLDIGKQFVKQMISEFIRLAVVNQILNSIFPGAGLPTISLGKRAGGGTVNPRQPYLVGEQGPEVFVPAGAGKIVPNGAMGSLGGSGGGKVVVQQTINIETGVAQTVRAEIATLLSTIKADTVKAVAEARRRGGSFAQAFGG